MSKTILCFFGLLLPVMMIGEFRVQGQTVTEITIQPDGNKLLFAPDEITAKAGSQLKVVMDNVATIPVMFHNVVFLNVGPDEDSVINEVGVAAMKAGGEKEYIPEHEAILAYTGMAKPGERQEVVFTVPSPGDYAYICSYLGHYVMMRGVLHSVE